MLCISGVNCIYDTILCSFECVFDWVTVLFVYFVCARVPDEMKVMDSMSRNSKVVLANT